MVCSISSFLKYGTGCYAAYPSRAIARGGEYYYEREYFAPALEYFNRALDNDPSLWTEGALWLHLGHMHCLGQGVIKNYSLAYDFFYKAHNQYANEAARYSACVWLGQMHYFGWGVEKNYRTASQFFRMAAMHETDLQTVGCSACSSSGCGSPRSNIFRGGPWYCAQLQRCLIVLYSSRTACM